MRNPFDRFGGAFTPRPRTFQMPNQGVSDNDNVFHSNRRFPGQPSTSVREQPEAPRNEWGSYLDEIRSHYLDEGEASKKYRAHMDAAPQYTGTSGWGRFGAALTGLSEGLTRGGGAGWAAGQEAQLAPHRQAVADWTLKGDALGRQADIEDDRSKRRIDYAKEVQRVAKTESEYRQAMREFELEQEKAASLDRYREAQIDDMKNRGWTFHTDDRGHRIGNKPGEAPQDLGPTSKIGDWQRTDRGLALEGRRTAATEQNARTAGGHLANARERTEIMRGADERAASRENRIEQAPISANEQSTARASAISRAALEGGPERWDKFVDALGNINPREATKRPEEFKRFMEAVQEHELGIFSRRRPGLSAPVDADEDVIDY